MKVEKVMTREVRTCHSGDTLATAAQLMWERDCGCLPVVSDDGRVVGMITDRDICMAAHFRGSAPREIVVGDVMSTQVHSVGPSEELADAEAIMRDAQVRRIPVVDASQALQGLVSLADLAREAGRKRRSRQAPISEKDVGDTLTAICTRRKPSRLAASA